MQAERILLDTVNGMCRCSPLKTERCVGAANGRGVTKLLDVFCGIPTLWAWPINCKAIAHQIVRYVHTRVARHSCCGPIKIQHSLVSFHQHIIFFGHYPLSVGFKLNEREYLIYDNYMLQIPIFYVMTGLYSTFNNFLNSKRNS